MTDAPLTADAFLGGRLTLLQPKGGLRAGSDAVLLAAACTARSGDSVLDLGCGVGAAMYCLGGRVPGLRLTGVERDPGLATLARRNGDAEVAEADVLDLPGPLRRSFDHVICNPPYFRAGAGRAAEDPRREAAQREADPESLPRWLDAAIRRAGPKGSVTFITRADRLDVLVAGMVGRLGRLVVLPIVSRAGQGASRVLVQGVKGRRAGPRLLWPLILHAGDSHLADGDDHTAEASAVLRDGQALALS